MANSVVRCGQCGAKNTDGKAFRCRLCNMLLPDAHAKRMTAAGADEGPSFSDIVESEVGTWRRSTDAYAAKAKRVFEQPESNNIGMTLLVALVVACALLVGAAQMLLA